MGRQSDPSQALLYKMTEEIAVLSENAEALKRWRRGIVVRWYLHGGSEFRQESIPSEFIDESSEVQEPGDTGKLVVLKVWADAYCITSMAVEYKRIPEIRRTKPSRRYHNRRDDNRRR